VERELRRFVPVLSLTDPMVTTAISLLKPEVAARLRPRIRAASPQLAALHAALPAALIYVDVDATTSVDRAEWCVPIVSVDTSIDALDAMAARSQHLALSVPAQRFEAHHELARRLEEIAAGLPSRLTVDLFVEVPHDALARVAETIASGAVGRIPLPNRWGSLVVAFRSDVEKSSTRGDLGRPHHARWMRPLTCRVTISESFTGPAETCTYPLTDRWIAADAMHRGSGRLLAELIASTKNFTSSCCVGDRWVETASMGDVDADDPAAWRLAALVHWLTSSTVLSGRLDGASSTDS
jgi:hypothetical protein